MIQVLGVSGSPRMAATHVLVQSALLGASGAGAETEYVSLAGKRITPCDGCDPCMAAGHCVITDDMTGLYPKLLAADVILLGTPVYFGSPSALCKAFMERVQGFGIREKRLRLKVGGSIATGAGRNAGQETALQAINLWFHINDMLPVGITSPASQWGLTGHTGLDPDDVHKDAIELKVARTTILSKEAAWLYGRKLATVGRIVKEGLAASGLDLPDPPYGFELPEFPGDLYRIR
jgi:multimeric flavodoxin WrbA